MNIQILIVDDDSLVVEFLEETLRRTGYSLTSAHSAESALEKMKTSRFHLVLSDIKMGGMDGIGLLAKIKELYPETTVIMMTAYGSVDTAVRAMKLGAFDFIIKPMSPEAVELRIQKAVERLNLIRENRALREDIVNRYKEIVGKSKAMQSVYDLITTAAPSNSTVLITGESGTGKEMVARAFHMESHRAAGPFVKLNCAALNQNLIESELFGHEKGAFTGAITSRAGRFEVASGGTLLLDEISEMPYETQAKLLRALQEREVEKVGSANTVQIDVRIVASSNRDLRLAIRQSKFREDLFYRLNVIPVHIPPLRERLEDIPLLADHFVRKYSDMNSRQAKEIDQSAYQQFMNYSWPGNVRELENYIERAVVISKGPRLMATDFPHELKMGRMAKLNGGGPEELNNGEITIADAEKILIMRALDRFSWNKARAAESLGITARTIRNKLKEYNVTNGDDGDEDEAQ